MVSRKDYLMNTWTDVVGTLSVRRVVNASGTMTSLGASSATREAIEAATRILPVFVAIDELQRHASQVIAVSTGAESGFVTACAAAGLTLGVAGAITGSDPGAIAKLPDTNGMRNEVVIQAGHLVDYGALIEQTLRVPGVDVRVVGSATDVNENQLRAALTEHTAAAVYVVSHHCVQRGQIPLMDFIRVCHECRVPVIVDAASEYDLRGFINHGADLVVYSAHKFLGGLTAGIVAGRADLVRACYFNQLGVGRAMKVGKEGIVGAIAALDAWARRDHEAVRRREEKRVRRWLEILQRPGLQLELSPDPTGNPITRLRVNVDVDLVGCAAWDIARELMRGDTVIAVRTDGINLGYFELDPCNLSDEEALLTGERILATVEAASSGKVSATDYGAWHQENIDAHYNWPN